MKIRRIVSTALLAASLAATAVMADTVAVSPEVITQVKQRFENEFKGIKVDEISATPFADILEVRIGKDILYTNAKMDFILQGALVDVATRTDLTAERLESLNRVDIASLPLDKAIKVVKGDGSRQVVVFEDPNCVYCKRLQQSLDAVDNVTVYSFLMPLLGPDSEAKSEHIWCADDPAATWLAWMKNNQLPAEKSCSTPVKEVMALGMGLGVRGTPMIIFADGSRANGWLPPDQLSQRVNDANENNKQ